MGWFNLEIGGERFGLLEGGSSMMHRQSGYLFLVSWGFRHSVYKFKDVHILQFSIGQLECRLKSGCWDGYGTGRDCDSLCDP